jgi:branched-subunit amino acid transport protein
MDKNFIIALIGMFIVTYIPRMLPAVGLSRVKLPSWFIEFLEYIPVAVLAALLLPSILVQNGHVELNLNNHYLIASIPAFAAAIFKRSLFIPVIVGLAAYIILSYV